MNFLSEVEVRRLDILEVHEIDVVEPSVVTRAARGLIRCTLVACTRIERLGGAVHGRGKDAVVPRGCRRRSCALLF